MELLNGKAKDLFLSFMCKKYRDFKWFEYAYLLDVCQSAIIIEWLDSVGIHIEFEVIDPVDLKFNYTVFCNDNFRTDTGRFLRIGNRNYKTRQEATTEAIKKAITLINESDERRNGIK